MWARAGSARARVRLRYQPPLGRGINTDSHMNTQALKPTSPALTRRSRVEGRNPDAKFHVEPRNLPDNVMPKVAFSASFTAASSPTQTMCPAGWKVALMRSGIATILYPTFVWSDRAQYAGSRRRLRP